jgi:hypothetical protein
MTQFPGMFETPSVTVAVARDMLERRPRDLWSVRIDGAGGAFVRVHWSPRGASIVTRSGGRAKTVQRVPPSGTGLPEAEKALARGWKYTPGTFDFEPLPEPFGTRVRMADWELLDGDAVLATAAAQGWVAVDLLDYDRAFQAQFRACRPFATGPATLYILKAPEPGRLPARGMAGDYRLAVAPDAHGRFYVGRMPDHAHATRVREEERVEGERLAKERARWSGPNAPAPWERTGPVTTRP